MNGQPFDRVPVFYFGTWKETLARWLSEGLTGPEAIEAETGMDPNWEKGMWINQGLANPKALSDRSEEVLEETDAHRVVRTSLGGVRKVGKLGSSITEHLEEDLKPTRKDWERFKGFLDPDDPARRPSDWRETARQVDAEDRVKCFFAGGLYGSLRGWLGTEQVSFLPYDDPALFDEMIEYLADFYMAMIDPVLDYVHFDFGYYFEDCCFNSGPLFSPATYERHFAPHYRRMIEHYKARGVPLILLDSDGNVEQMVPLWLRDGVDIIFPLEVGTWRADPVAYRREYGKRIRMFGGVDKHVIPRGQEAIRAELERLVPLVAEGGYIPIPDHRIPPSCSLEQFRTYTRVFKEVLAGAGTG
jgi:uroporphyrinogen decarboxylase